MLTILDNKPVIGTTTEEFRLDLLYRSRDANYLLDESMMVIVKKNEEMRPDILSANFFASTQYYDVLLKHNGISNPFSINEGDIFVSSQLNDMITNNTADAKQSASMESVRQQYANPNKKSLTDTRLTLIAAKRDEAEKNRIQSALNKFAQNSNIPGSMLPPNIAEVGDREITVVGGKVYFGKDVIRGTEQCAEPISKSEFLAKLIKNRNV